MSRQTIFEFKSSGFNEVIRQYDELGTAQKKLESLVRTLAKAFEADGASKQGAILAAKELAKANNITAQSIQQLTARQKELQQGSSAIEALVKRRISAEAEAAKATAAQEKAVESLGFTLKGNVSAFNALNAAFKGNAVEAQNAVNAYEKLRNNGATLAQTQQALASQLGVTDNQFKVLNKTLNDSRASVEGAQQQLLALGLTVSGAVAVAFAKGILAYADFERVIKQIGVISDSTGTPALKALEGTIKQLAATTTKTPQEIADVTKELVKAGFSAEEATVALNGIVKGSEATGESLVTVGDVIAKTIRQFNLSASDSTRIADLLTKTANSTNTDVRGLGESLKFVGVAANQSNQDVEDVLVVLGLLGDAGLQAGQGGRNLAQALTRINVASAELPPELEKVVKGSAKMRSAFELLGAEIRNADNQLKPLPEVIKILKTSLQGFDEGEQAVILKALFGEEGGRAIGAAINRSFEDIDKAIKDVRNASGEVDKQSAVLTQGLSGAFDQFGSTTQLLATNIGEILAPAVELLVRSATTLIKEFLALPTPVQALVVGVAVLAGVLGAATVAITAYNLAVSAGVVANAGLAVSMVANTLAIAKDTAVTVTATTAKIAFAAATGNFAAAQALTTAALSASSVALAPFLAGLVAALPVIIAVAGALAIIKFFQFANDMKEANDQLDVLTSNTTNSINEFGQIAGKIRSFNQAVKENGSLTAEQTKQAQGYIQIAKQKIKSLDDEIKAYKAIKNPTEEQKRGIEASTSAIEQQKVTLGNMVKALENNIAVSKAKAGQDARSADASLEGTQANLDRAKAIDAETEALKRNNEAQKQRDKDAFDDSERTIKRTQDDQKQVRDEQNKIEENQVNEKFLAKEKAIKEQNETAVNAIKEAGEAKLQAAKKNFDASQQTAKAAFEKTLQAESAAFNKQQNSEKEAFERKLREETRVFNRQQSEEKKAFDKQASIEQKGIDRQVQLQGAKDDPAELARLQKQFAEEDKLAAYREQLEAPLRAKKEAFEKEQQAKKDAFEAEQQAKKQAFEEAQQAAKDAFETAQQTKKAAFEAKQQAQKEAFEVGQAAKRQQLEAQINEVKKQQEAELAQLKKQQETEISNLRKQQAQEERQIERQQEDERIARERKFRDEQNAKDLEVGKKIEALKAESDKAQQEAARLQQEAADKQLQAAQLNAQNGANSENSGESVPGRDEPVGRFKGGNVDPGKSYIVGEREPELFVPGVRGTILNQKQIAANLNGLLNASVSTPGIRSNPTDSTRLIKEVKELRKTVESRDPKIEIYPQIQDTPKSQESLIRLQRAIIRGML